jgi:hypothetical protein
MLLDEEPFEEILGGEALEMSAVVVELLLAVQPIFSNEKEVPKFSSNNDNKVKTSFLVQQSSRFLDIFTPCKPGKSCLGINILVSTTFLAAWVFVNRKYCIDTLT